MANRQDLLPPGWAQELRRLQDEATPVQFEAIKGVIEEELGQSAWEAFAEFDPCPVGAASIAQVHRAILKDGTRVIVKVQRPGIRPIVETDLDILFRLAQGLERSLPFARQLHPIGVVEEFARKIRQELDFVYEAHNAERFGREFQDDPTVYIPKIYQTLTRSRVLVQEEVQGIKISDLDALDRAGMDRSVIAARGADLVLRQVFIHGFFHADPHPGNIFVLPGNIIAPVDFGMVSRLSPKLRHNLLSLLQAALHKNLDQVIEVLPQLGIARSSCDSDSLRDDLEFLLEKYDHWALRHIQVRELVGEVNCLVRRHGLRLPQELVYLGKALSQLEDIGFALDSQFDTFEHARPFVRRMIREPASPEGMIQDLEGWFSDLIQLLRVLPRGLLRGVERLAQPPAPAPDGSISHPGKNRRPSVGWIMGGLTGVFFLGFLGLAILAPDFSLRLIGVVGAILGFLAGLIECFLFL
jgi:ubiquinone biosynthesis protein